MGQVSDKLRQEGETCIPELVKECPVALTTRITVIEQVSHSGSVFEVVAIVVGFTLVQHPPRVFVV